jgi:hypothetical protein
MNFDEHISRFKDRTCAVCRMPYAAFSRPIPAVNLTMVAYPGSYKFRAGKRTVLGFELWMNSFLTPSLVRPNLSR